MKNRTQAVFVIVIIITVFIVSAMLVTFPLSAQHTTQNKKDEPTPIQLGFMTERQRKHSRLYSSELVSSKNLLSGTKDVYVVFASPWKEPLTPSSQEETYLKDIICRADAIASAKVNDKSSQLTEDLQFVFTDYSLEIKHILKNTSPAQTQPASIITITTPGGAVKINNRIINVAVKSNKRLEIGKEYLLFLDYLPDSDSFKLNRAESVFDISDNRVEKFGIAQSPSQKNDKDIAAVTDLVNKIKTECSLTDGNEE